jgi:hypothetical protein
VFEKENVEDTKFGTMLDAYWWALITMTTVSMQASFCKYKGILKD